MKHFFKLILLCCTFFLSWSLALSNASELGKKNNLVVTFLDVGQGDSAVIETPSHKTILIDAGTNDTFFDGNFDAGATVITPFLRSENVQTIAAVLISHPHLDHYGGLFTLLKNFTLDEFIDGPYPVESILYAQLLEQILERSIPHHLVQAGDHLDWDDQLTTEILWPPSPASLENFKSKKKSQINNRSIILKITYKKISFLFSGDVESAAELALIAQLRAANSNLKVTFLKAAHHGSMTSSSKEFLDAVHPELVVISCGRNNQFHHPHAVVLERLSELGVPSKRTDEDGSIQVITDGESYQIQNLPAAQK